jgi:DNA-binding transcriptional MerR regulator
MKIKIMRIGDLADKAGVNIQTLRFYERKGILRQPPRTASGYRAYTDKDLHTVLFVRRCQGVGFTLKEICRLAELHAAGDDEGRPRTVEARRGIQTLARERLAVVDQQIEMLKGMRSQLLGLLHETDGQPDPVCPFKKAE